MYTRISNRRKERAMTIMEVLVGTGIGCATLSLLAGFFGLSFQSIAGLTNYATLEYASRKALDQITYTVRQSHVVLSNSPTSIQLQIVQSDGTSKAVRFEFDDDTDALNMIDENGNMTRLLGDCDNLKFEYFQRPAPGDSWSNLRELGTNSPNLCKVVQVSWKCSRPLVGTLQNTEVMQSTKIVLRSSNWKTDAYALE